MALYQCPCCDYFTLDEPCAWDICPVCFWEDDLLGIDQPDSPSPANHGLTVREARENFRVLGACEATMVENIVPESQRVQFRREVRQLGN